MSDADWRDIRDCYVAGYTSKVIAEKYGVTSAAVRMRASRENWPTPERMASLLGKSPKDALSLPEKAKRSRKNELMEELSEDVQIEHRARTAKLAMDALKKAGDEKNPTLKAPSSWRDAEIADKMARRALGLEDGAQQSTLVQVGVLAGRIGEGEGEIVDLSSGETLKPEGLLHSGEEE